MDKKYKPGRTINGRSYRLLSKCKQDKDINISEIKEGMSNNGFNKKKNICNNIKENTERHRHSHKGSLYFEGYSKKTQKNQYSIPKTKKYSYFEKQIFRELDYKDSLKNYKIINYKEYEKLIRRKRGIKIVLISLLILLLIIPILDFSLRHFLQKDLLELSGLLTVNIPLKSSYGGIVEGYMSSLFSNIELEHSTISLISNIFLYCLPIFILVVIFILGMVYYYRKVIKYENIKFRKKSHE
ncbi:Plasmodium exported protein (Pm-fam-a like), unknown function [Plasmodium malariae]|uniref:Fam-l protein n=1 Tax=Plasmodium malariae TaxID=5858 RepID=A0A1A8WIU4_PLAMA|nr:Plasmodium exported protein (Pm-fam-a like), unknown function [Plasmodium malariae]